MLRAIARRVYTCNNPKARIRACTRWHMLFDWMTILTNYVARQRCCVMCDFFILAISWRCANCVPELCNMFMHAGDWPQWRQRATTTTTTTTTRDEIPLINQCKSIDGETYRGRPARVRLRPWQQSVCPFDRPNGRVRCGAQNKHDLRPAGTINRYRNSSA